MKKELNWFSIDGSLGGNQDRMNDLWMKLGGCAALAAVDSCLLLTLHNGFSGICPIDPACLNWESYNRFAEIMRPYLSPRMMGVNKLRYYFEGFGAYLRDIGCRSLKMDLFPMGTPVEKARSSVKQQIGAGLPVPILHLNPQNRRVKDFRWHWFMLGGYEETEKDFLVKAVTYGQETWLRLDDLWNETDPENGGLILYRSNDTEDPSETVRKAAALIFDRADKPEKVLALRSHGGESCLLFPSVAVQTEEESEEALQRELPKVWNLSVTVSRLVTVHEYDTSSRHVSERYYKAVLSGESDIAGDLVWLSDSDLENENWRPCDLPLISIIRSELADIDVIRKRIAEQEAKDAESRQAQT